MNSCDNFLGGFEKIAAPAWFYEMNRTLNRQPKLKGMSRVGLRNTRIGKGLVR